MRWLFVSLRTAAAFAVIIAVAVNFAASLTFWVDAGFRDVPGLVANFFSYLTIVSILFSAAVLATGAVLLARGQSIDPPWFALLRACAVTYLVIVGVVYNALLRHSAVSGPAEIPQWTNEVMHVAVPLYLVVDWFVAPGRRRMSWRTVPRVLIAPTAWLVYTLVRAPAVYDQFTHVQGWYPYPFLDPETSSGGYLAVAVHIAAITLVFAVVATVVVVISRWPQLRRSRHTALLEAVPSNHVDAP